MAVRVRRDVWNLSVGTAAAARDQAWHPVLDGYARAVAAMQAGNNTPTVDSWFWAAFTHGIPAGIAARPLWDQCEHGSPFFLPWHRAYLAWFEHTVQVAAGDPTWALPYWDYSDPNRAKARTLPPEFTVPKRTVNGNLVTNALFAPDPQIATNRNPGPIPQGDIDLVRALSESRFARAVPRQGFGGVDDARRFFGLLEARPHNDIHMDVAGLMSSTTTAGLDPIFWVHHANIDRLWEAWRALPGSTPLPTTPSVSSALTSKWNTATFRFGGGAATVTYHCTAMDADPEAALGYTYESTDLEPSVRAEILTARGIGGRRMGIDDLGEDEDWEAVASVSDVAVPSTGAHHDLAFAGGGMALAASPPTGLVVELSDVRAEQPHPAYLVDVRASDTSPWHRAGRISTFGLLGTPADETRSYLVDVSDAIAQLTDDGWSGRDLGVQLRPDPEHEVGAAEPAIAVGQITVYTSGS